MSSVDPSPLTEKESDRDHDHLRQRAVAPGPPSDDLGILASLLRFAAPEADMRPVAALLMQTFGTLDGALSAPREELSQLSGMTDASVTLLKLVDSINRRRITITIARPEGHAHAVDNHPSVAPEIQPELFPVARSAQPELALPTRRAIAAEPKSAGAAKAIQDVLLAEGSLAVKLSAECQSLEQLQEVLIGRLGQNSIETRRRYVQSIARWFFSDGIDGLLRRAWLAYGDDAILTDLLRWSFLEQEPVMGASVAEALFPLENGIAIPPTYFDKFLGDYLGEAPPEKTRERLKTNLKKLGFLERNRGKPDRLTPAVPQNTSFLILLHHLFAPKSVRTIELLHLFANPFWKLIGYKSEDAVRILLREADDAGVVAKYVVADQLEQVTTCFAFDELLERRVRL